MGTCHLPLWALNHVLLQLLTFNAPWNKFRVDSKNEALCALGKTNRTDSQIVSYFRSQLYEPNSCISPYIKSTKILQGDNSSWWLPETFCKKKKKNLLDCMYSPFTKIITYVLTWPITSWSSFSELPGVLSPGCCSPILPQIKLNSQFSHCLFFFKLASVFGWASLVAQMVKKSACNREVPGSCLGSRRAPGVGNGGPLQHSCLENSMDKGA